MGQQKMQKNTKKKNAFSAILQRIKIFVVCEEVKGENWQIKEKLFPEKNFFCNPALFVCRFDGNIRKCL